MGQPGARDSGSGADSVPFAVVAIGESATGGHPAPGDRALGPGDVLSVRSGGGGGWGSPREREPERDERRAQRRGNLGMLIERHTDILGNGQRGEQRAILEHHPEPPPQRVHRIGRGTLDILADARLRRANGDQSPG